MNCASAFDAADCEAGCVREAGYHPRLPLQWGLQCLVEFCWLVQVDDVDVPVCGADDEELVASIDAVDPFLAGDGGDGVGRPQIPVFDGFVP